MRRYGFVILGLTAAACGGEEEETEELPALTCAQGELKLRGNLGAVKVDEVHPLTPPHRFVNVEGGLAGSIDVSGPDGTVNLMFVERLTAPGSVGARVELKLSVPSATWLDNCATDGSFPSTVTLDEDSGGGRFLARELHSVSMTGACEAVIEGELEGCFRFP